MHSHSIQTLKKLIWALYIYLKAKALNRSKNYLECAPLMLALLMLILVDVDNQKFPTKFINEITEAVNKDQEGMDKEFVFKAKKFEQIKRHLLFKLQLSTDTKDTNEANQLNEYKDMIKNVISKSELAKFSNNKEYELTFDVNPDDDQKLQPLIEQVKSLYENMLISSHFDERLFLVEKNNADCSPQKLTPIRRSSFHFSLTNMHSENIIKKPYQKALFGSHNHLGDLSTNVLKDQTHTTNVRKLINYFRNPFLSTR